MRNGSKTGYISMAYYGILCFLLVAVLFDFLGDLLPFGAKHIARNSEGITAAIVVGLWVQFARPRLHGSRWEWPLTAAASLGFLTVALVFYHAGSWPTRVTTLNETLFALVAVIPFVQASRRHPRPALAVSGAVLAVILFGQGLDLVTNMAETLAILLLVPVGLDFIDRGILDPDGPTRRAVRYGWYLFLIAAPLAFHVLQYRMDSTGWLGDIVQYGVRLNEAFIFMLLFEAYFTFALGRAGKPAERGGLRHAAVADPRSPA